MAVRRKSGCIEDIFKKHKLELNLVQQFEVVSGPQSALALYNLNICGHLTSNGLRSIAKDILKFYSVEKAIFDLHLQFHINECSPFLKSAFVLFPVFLQRSPESISTKQDVLKAIRWINKGVSTGDSIASVVFRCCMALLPLAVELDCVEELAVECFLKFVVWPHPLVRVFSGHNVRKQWLAALRNCSNQNKGKVFDEIKRRIGKDSYLEECLDTDNNLFEWLLLDLSKIEEVCEKNNREVDDDFSDSDFGEDVETVSEKTTKDVETFYHDLFSQIQASNESTRVVQMAEVIKGLSYLDLEVTEDGFQVTRMPRNSICKFYKHVKALIRAEAEHHDVEHFKQLMIIQLATHSKKIIDFCQLHLDAYTKKLAIDDFESINNFFWLHFLRNPPLFRPYAVSSVVKVLCSHTMMIVYDVVTKLCQLSKDSGCRSLDNKCDIILGAVLAKNYSFDLDFHNIYAILMKFDQFRYYRTWMTVFDGIFTNVPSPISITYFCYQHRQLLEDTHKNLERFLSDQTPLINRLELLQSSLLLLERFRCFGPPGFKQNPLARQDADLTIELLRRVRVHCPAFYFIKRIDEMSHQYADLLSSYDNKGVLGAPEYFDSMSDIETKAELVAQLLKESKCCMVYTGAGISTSANIPDFRGPTGIWTLEQKQKQSQPTSDMTIDSAAGGRFEDAQPTFTHQCLKVLERHGFIKFLLTQNVDGLHSRFGFPLDRLAEVHGNVFVERCNNCNKQYFRDQPLQSVGRKPTGAACETSSSNRACRGKLCDFLLDWEDELPEPEFGLAQKFATAADLAICLGTSLQIRPVGNMPLLAKKNGGKFVTINLQDTKHEKKADIAVHGRVDEVMRLIIDKLGLLHEVEAEPIVRIVKLKSESEAFVFSKKRKRTQLSQSN